MNKKLKYLIYVIGFLVPIVIFSFCKKETIFNNEIKNKIYVEILLKDNTKIKEELENYVLGVVAAEMPASFTDEALKAQSVAARTFAVNKLNNNLIKIDTDAQAYITKDEMKIKWNNNFDKYYSKLKLLVDSTQNQIITYNGKVIKSYYFSMSNGQTEDSIIVFNETKPYLQSVNSSLEENLDSITNTKVISKSDFCQILVIKNCDDIKINSIKTSVSKRVESLYINNNYYTGIELRKKLNLRSTDFIIEIKNNDIIITTKGYGHGVGMSQYGANELAKKGYDYKEIIKYYYQGVEVVNIDSIK